MNIKKKEKIQMKQRKTRWPVNEIIDVWLNEIYDAGCSNSMSFNENLLYSYGTTIAKKLDKKRFLVKEYGNNSVTTAKHISWAMSEIKEACPDETYIAKVHQIYEQYDVDNTAYIKNEVQAQLKEAKEYIDSASRARSNKEWQARGALNILENVTKLLSWANLPDADRVLRDTLEHQANEHIKQASKQTNIHNLIYRPNP